MYTYIQVYTNLHINMVQTEFLLQTLPIFSLLDSTVSSFYMCPILSARKGHDFQDWRLVFDYTSQNLYI